jgi:threonine dehydrogenase-like Zn-dependent dehydrogenase
MLAATYTQGGKFEVADVPEPRCGEDEVLVGVTAASICGTDIKIVHNGHRKLRDGQRIVLGHEFVGEIAAVGSRVRGFRAGQRVGVAPNAGCGKCAACVQGKTNYCPGYTAFGIDRDGGHAPCVVVPAAFVAQGNVVPLPDAISDREASVLEPFSCVVNGVRACRIAPGDAVVIYGAGPIGLMHVMLCRASGAGRIVAADVRDDRLDQARSAGADVVVNSAREDVKARVTAETGGAGADVVITACPAPEAQEQGLEMLAPLGRLCLFGGLPRGSAKVALDTNAIHYRNLTVTGTTGGSVEDYRAAIRLVEAKRVDIGAVISDTFGLKDLAAAYKCAESGPKGKVVMVA